MKYGRKFTDEDFYIYMTAHEYKHFSIAGPVFDLSPTVMSL